MFECLVGNGIHCFEAMKTSFEALSYAFALSIVQSHEKLCERRVFALGSQLLRLGTAVGALNREAQCAQSKADFISKLSSARKECNECRYWLNLLNDSSLLEKCASLH